MEMLSSLQIYTTLKSGSLFHFDTEPKTQSMSAQVSLMLVRLATESKSAASFLKLVHTEPVLAAVRQLLLEGSGMSRKVEGPQKRRLSRRAPAGRSACARY